LPLYNVLYDSPISWIVITVKNEAVRGRQSYTRMMDLLALSFSIFLLSYMLLLKPGMDNIVDLMNYHAYNGWSVVSGEWWNHFHPAFVHSYYINWYDVFHWLLIDNFSTNTVVIMLTVIHMTIVVPIYLITRELLTTASTVRLLWISILSLSTAQFLTHVGGFNGDILTAIPMLFAIWLLIKITHSPSMKLSVLAGVLTGLSLALKLTNIGYFPFFALFLIYWAYKKRWLNITVIAISTFTSFILLILPQSLAILSTTDWKNPLFPMYNNIFKSSLAPYESLSLDHYKIPFHRIDDYAFYDMVMYSLNIDMRYLMVLIIMALVLITFIYSGVRSHFRKTSNIQENYSDESLNYKSYFIMLLAAFASFILFASVFNTSRYTVGVWILFTPLIIIGLYYLIDKWFKGVLIQRLLFPILSLSIIVLLTLTINPSMGQVYKITDGDEELFKPIVSSEVTKYDSIILPGPGLASWLMVLHREHIEETGQLWLSTAFNREDAKRADKMLEGRDIGKVGYINAGGPNNFAEKNLNTLGFTDGGNCKPLDIDKYGFWYSIYVVCDAVYTGKYSYNVVNEYKVDGSNEAATPVPPGSTPPDLFVRFRR
jgi:hypothetical protein